MESPPQFWPTFLLAIGIAGILEGLLYATFANRVEALSKHLSELGPSTIRALGLGVAVMSALWLLLQRYLWF